MTMTPARWKRLEALFSVVVDLEPDARRELLERECGHDEALLAHIRQLVEQDRSEQPVLRTTVRSAWRHLLRDFSDDPLQDPGQE